MDGTAPLFSNERNGVPAPIGDSGADRRRRRSTLEGTVVVSTRYKVGRSIIEASSNTSNPRAGHRPVASAWRRNRAMVLAGPPVASTSVLAARPATASWTIFRALARRRTVGWVVASGRPMTSTFGTALDASRRRSACPCTVPLSCGYRIVRKEQVVTELVGQVAQQRK